MGCVVFSFWRKKKKNWPDTLAWIRKSFPGVRQLPCADLAAWLADSAKTPPQLLDVRDADEFEVSHLPGARHLPMESDPESGLACVARDQLIVVYCASGYRSSRFAQKLLDAGFSNVANLEGSIFQWANEGRPLESDGKPADKVHACDAAWGELLLPTLRFLPEE